MNAIAEPPKVPLAPAVADFCRRAVEALRAKLPVREVWLFGSQAEGRANRHSDFDFLVVLADDHGIRRPNHAAFSATGDAVVGESVDTITVTESRWRKEQAAPWGLFGDIIRKGVRLA